MLVSNARVPAIATSKAGPATIDPPSTVASLAKVAKGSRAKGSPQRRAARQRATRAAAAGSGLVIVSAVTAAITQAKSIGSALGISTNSSISLQGFLVPAALVIGVLLALSVKDILQRRKALMLLWPTVMAATVEAAIRIESDTVTLLGDKSKPVLVTPGHYLRRSTVVEVLATTHGYGRTRNESGWAATLLPLMRRLKGGLDRGTVEEIADAILLSAVERNWIAPAIGPHFDDYYSPRREVTRTSSRRPR
jgi:hypothetical protein